VGHLTRIRIQDEFVAVSAGTVLEVKHLSDGAGDTVEAPLANALSSEPVVFDEA
jgi:hypothetical protein